jgi:hypothetical protein
MPGHNQAKTCWENVTTAEKACGIPFDNPCTIQCHSNSVKAKFITKRAKEEATAGVKDFDDEDEDPFHQ